MESLQPEELVGVSDQDNHLLSRAKDSREVLAGLARMGNPVVPVVRGLPVVLVVVGQTP